ncbi:alkanesulfonate monooxygenase SsuD/methylene tetrahydromethanopterin reductase-like flavin-dependent oxidoreductase (luciferase family) [Arthrobacter sp. PvP023]|uniref:LLM class flavin-dependent oxidoreductase n=1 Tax=Micrococcaceae TaxID=1268 RepID=UPI001AEADE86|nr:LLM class flavin-dependent oxidoreductase [Arthrobacter sp. PvP023]MBP1134316.1 alkanesulfonate monooxygenase SsuD/methylene tetrahydromethanopterin reductase-like flavin-dependent oxidoreductase (luciferase family) [Arthrobacter sp. PvP023]
MSNANNTPGGWGFLALELDGATGGDTAGAAPALAAAVLAAESAGFHAVTFRDAPEEGRLNALQRAAFAGPLTRRIALIPEVDTAYTEPFHAATQLASLDYVSGGRAGWIATAADDRAAAAAVGRTHVTGDGLAREAAASIEVSRRLWDSWEDDAVIRDVASGRYLDAGRLHYVDFDGPGYSVKGPSIIPRPLQGQLPVFVPAALVGDGLVEPAAVDAVLVSAPTVELLADEVREVRERLGGGSPAVVVELDVVLDARGQTAAQRLGGESSASGEDTGGEAAGAQRARFAGSAAELADLLTEVLEVADGVRLHPARFDVDFQELSRLVLPELRRRGVLAQVSQDGTFRDLLGLERPASRYAATAVGN